MVRKRHHELKVPYWIMDGFNGVLALVFYNFLLYLSKAFERQGIVRQMESVMGNFGANTFIKLGFEKTSVIFGITSIFIFAFLLGMIIAMIVRIVKKEKLEP